MHIIAIANQKGGVGKTTTTVNLGVALSRRNKRVLLLDFDPQGNMSDTFGWSEEKVSEAPYTVYGAMREEYKLTPVSIGKNIDLCLSNIDLAASEIECASEPGREFILKRLLQPLNGSYDFVLIDCPPTLSLFTTNALTACTDLLIPVSAEYLPTKGLKTLMRIVHKVRDRLNPSLHILGILLTKVSTRTNLARVIDGKIREAYPTQTLNTICRNFISLAEAPSFEKSIFEHAPKSDAAQDFDDLCDELMARLASPSIAV